MFCETSDLSIPWKKISRGLPVWLRHHQTCGLLLFVSKEHIRAEYVKTRVGRDIYISDEATGYLKQWLDWKYRKSRSSSPNDSIFNTFSVESKPETLYVKLGVEFTKVLKAKEGMRRRMITLHSLRRFVKTLLSD